MTKVFYCSTLFGALSLAAAIDAGQFGEPGERRVLIASNNAAVPEIARRFEETAGFATVRSRFDHVVGWNELITPLHPAGWTPPAAELPVLSRLVSAALGLAAPVTELVVESIAVAPARTIAQLIRDCPITVFSDGLMSYGPTRDSLPGGSGDRVERLLHLDLVPALRPLLLREYGVPAVPIPDAEFAAVLAAHPVPDAATAARGQPVIVGQYLAAVDVLAAAEETELHARMLRALAARGHRRVVFKPHPAAGRSHGAALRAAAQRLGIELTVAPDDVPAEVWFAHTRPDLIVSCFSTALLTARHFFDRPIATMGCDLALERITPYQNSNRIPATIVDATVPRLRADGTIAEPAERDIAGLVEAVGYCMQSARYPELRAGAAAYLEANGPAPYFKRRRLHAVGLTPPPPRRTVLASRARATAKRVLGDGRGRPTRPSDR